MKFKDRLKEQRLLNKMTLEELGTKIGVSRQTIQRYESGVIKNIPPDKVELIAKYLHTTPGYLMGWKNKDGDISDDRLSEIAHYLITKSDELESNSTPYFECYEIYISELQCDYGVHQKPIFDGMDYDFEEHEYKSKILADSTFVLLGITHDVFLLKFSAGITLHCDWIHDSGPEITLADVYIPYNELFEKVDPFLCNYIDKDIREKILKIIDSVITESILFEFSDYIGLDDLKIHLNTKTVMHSNRLFQEEKKMYRVKVVEKLSAGTGYNYQKDNETYSVYTDRDDLPNYDIASYITGDSMEPRYHDGDVALIQLGYDNIHGGIYAVDYDGESYLKKVFFENDRIRLVSLNKKYDDIIIDLPVEQGTYLNIVGKVVGSFTPVEV